MASSARTRQGHLSRAVGDLFEGQVKAQLVNALEARQIAWMHHTQPLWRMVGKNRFVPAAAGLADFVGQLNGGRAFAIEVKSTAELRYHRSKLPEHQAAHLDACARGGGLALLALELREPFLQRYVIPWARIPWRAVRSAPSIGHDDLEQFSMNSGFLLLPFISGPLP